MVPPAEIFTVRVGAAPEFVRAPLVTIVALGLRIGEYLRLDKHHLLPHTDSVRVPGKKTAGSADVVRVDERLWPWIVAGTPSLTDEGAPEARVQVEMRHATAAMTRRYTK